MFWLIIFLSNVSYIFQEEMQKLNSLVWPLIGKEVEDRVDEFSKSGKKIVVVEAAVLQSAGWSTMCDEIWACIIPPEIAITRLKIRNGLSEDDAKARLSMQISNTKHVENANVVLSTEWSFEYTQQIVERAWKLLAERIA